MMVSKFGISFFQGSILQVPFKTVESMCRTVTYLHLNIYHKEINEMDGMGWVMFDSFHAAHDFCCFLMLFIRSDLSGLQGPRRHCPCRHACHLLWMEVERASWFFNCASDLKETMNLLNLCGQIIIFHQPRFPWNNWIALTIRYLLVVF